MEINDLEGAASPGALPHGLHSLGLLEGATWSSTQSLETFRCQGTGSLQRTVHLIHEEAIVGQSYETVGAAIHHETAVWPTTCKNFSRLALAS